MTAPRVTLLDRTGRVRWREPLPIAAVRSIRAVGDGVLVQGAGVLVRLRP